YAQYWRIRQGQLDGGAAYDASYVVSADPSSPLFDALSEQFGSAIRTENPAFTDGEVAPETALRIRAYEEGQTEAYHELHAKVGGLTDGFDADYAYSAGADERKDLTRGATWT